MSKKIALISGITGQDGHHLTKLLLTKDYEVHGLVNGQRNSREEGFVRLFPEAKLHRGDLTDFSSLLQVIDDVSPDEIYNLGAMSHVKVSFDMPEYVANVDGMGTLRLLEAIRVLGLEQKTRIYQASTSELYGGLAENKNEKGLYDEKSPFYPRSPYGAAKIYGLSDDVTTILRNPNCLY